MKFAIGIPQIYPDGTFAPSDFRSYLARVEELGVYESAWTQESVLGFSRPGAAPQLAPLELLAYAAACTSTLRLGCTVFVTTLHTPAHLAKGLATVDQLAGGRLEIGVGSGGPGRPFAADPAGRRAGLRPGEFPIAKRVYIGIDQVSGARARDRMTDALAGLYGARMPAIESAAVAGTVDECLNGIRAVIAAGAQMIVFTPLYDVNEHMELIADLIIPAVLSPFAAGRS
jgi:alkanesulfonate monooxygenase SsuD/methylene tetrahydromethanopterin reductase-like flavin-dependent oxidoreductase (luciferase family)